MQVADEMCCVDEKHPERASNEALGSCSPITYLYLTFNSILPVPPTSQEEAERSLPENLPEAPDLRAYTSPLTWPLARKNVLLVLTCIATFLTAYSAGSYSPPSAAMAIDLGTSHLASLVGITTFCLGFAFAPMALAPISEIWGRYPVLTLAGIVYVVFQAVCSVMTNLAGMLVARFLVGVGGSVFSSVVGGVLADLWNKEDRNTPMAIFSGAVLAGTGAGPLVSAAFIEGLEDDTLAWKWSFWHQAAMDSVLVIAIILFFRESRAPVLLTRKAKRLNEWYEKLELAGVWGMWVDIAELEATTISAVSSNTTLHDEEFRRRPTSLLGRSRLQRIRWVVKEDEQRASLSKMVATSISRPFYLLFTEPVVFCFSLWAAFSWGVLYLSFAVVPFLYSNNLNMSSRVYIAMIVASIVATIVGTYQEELMKHPSWRRQNGDKAGCGSKFWAFMRKHFPVESPEARLYFACITAMMLPAGLFGAFLCPPSMEGYSHAVGLGFATWGIYSVYLATFNYLADTYSVYASSALAAQSFCRNVLGGAFPLITSVLFRNLGLKGAGGLLGGIAMCLTVIPWVLVLFGERIRARSNFAIVSFLVSNLRRVTSLTLKQSLQ